MTSDNNTNSTYKRPKPQRNPAFAKIKDKHKDARAKRAKRERTENARNDKGSTPIFRHTLAIANQRTMNLPL